MGRKKLNLDKELLYNLYIRQELSAYRIAKMLKCSKQAIQSYLCKYNIPVRSRSEALKRCKKNGGKYKTTGGYIMILKSNHPNSDSRGYIM